MKTERCHECGSKSISTTLMYCFGQDTNQATCNKCEWSGRVYELDGYSLEDEEYRLQRGKLLWEDIQRGEAVAIEERLCLTVYKPKSFIQIVLDKEG